MPIDPGHGIIKGDTMKKIKGINRKASKNKRYTRRIGYREFISSIEARKALVKSLNLMDDTFFAAVMEDKEVCTYVLREITGIDTLTVKACKVQYHIRNLISHSVILDILAEDDSGRVYNIEVQKSNEGNHPKRIRSYQANLDSVLLGKGCDYSDLPEAYFIFISSFDPFGLNDNYYEVERKLKGRDSTVPNGVHEIYLNTKITTDRDITKLLQYFKNSDASREDFGPLSDKVRFYKNNEKGGVTMCEKVQRLIDESNEELRKKYAKELEKRDRVIEKEKAEIARLKAQIAAIVTDHP